MNKKERIKKLKAEGFTDEEIKGGTAKNIEYEARGCGITTGKFDSKDGLFDGLTQDDMEELSNYIFQERLPDGTVIVSYRDAVARLKFAKWLNGSIKK